MVENCNINNNDNININININDKDNTNNSHTESVEKAKKWDRWGTRGYTVMPHVSPESKKIAESYRLRPSDVVVLTFPKTGTTWTQTVCEQLRTNAEGYDGFDEITERQPWLEFAYDCGQDLDEDPYGMAIPTDNDDDNDNDNEDSGPPPRGPLLTPRIFKSHQLLSAINPGGKYLCIVRDPAATLLSWFYFQKAKGRPGYAEYEDANEYIAHRPELFAGNHIFGTNLWEAYAELWSARNDPSVKTLVYEGLIADAPNGYMDHLPVIADFLGLKNLSSEEKQSAADANADTNTNTNNTKSLYERVAGLVSRAEMVRHVDKFDDHFIADRGTRFGRALRVLEPAPKVRTNESNAKRRTELSEATLEWLEDRWLEFMTPLTGHATYDEFATDLSELLFADVVADVDVVADDELEFDESIEEERNGNGTTAQGDTNHRRPPTPTQAQAQAQTRKSSIVMRRKSSLVVQQMPGIRRRRESLVPHE